MTRISSRALSEDLQRALAPHAGKVIVVAPTKTDARQARTLRIIAMRWPDGIGGPKGMTIRAISDETGVSESRVRAICDGHRAREAVDG